MVQSRRQTVAPPAATSAHGTRDEGVRQRPPDPAGLLDRITDGLVALDPEFRYTFVNQQAAVLLGRPVAELVGGSYYELFPDAVGTPFERAYAAAMADQAPAVIEDYYEPWDRWFENRIYPLGDGIAILFTEITERKRVAQQLAFQAELLGTVSEAVMATGPDLSVVFWNHGAEQLFGWSANEAIGRQLGEIVPAASPDDRAEILAALRRDGAWRGVNPRRRRDGSVFDVQLLLSARRLPDGAFGGMIGVAIDVSERSAAQREADRQRKRLTALHEIERLVIAGGSVNDIATTAVRVARVLSGADLAGLGLADRSTGRVTTAAADGVSAILTPADRRPWTIAFEPLRRGEMIVIDDLETVATRSPSAAAMVEEGWHTSLTAPMLVEGDFVGLLSLAWREPGRATDEHRATVAELATTVAVGIRQAMLREETERRARALEAVHGMSAELQVVRPTRELAAAAIAVLERVVGHRYGAILLIDPATRRLEPLAISHRGRSADRAFREAHVAAIRAHDLRVGRGITGWVAEHGESVRLSDATADPRYLGVRLDVHSELCVPIRSDSGVIGVVNVESPELDAYSDDDQLVLETVASQLGIALANARLFDDLEARVADLRRATDRLESIASVTELALLDLPLEELLASLLERVRQALASDTSTIALAEPGTNELVVRSSVGIPLDPHRPVRLPIGQGFVGRIAAERRPIVVDDTAGFDFVGSTLPKRLRSLVGVPMVIDDRVIGVLHVGSRAHRSFDDDDVRVLSLVAERAAAEIERARLSDELTRHAAELEARVEQRTHELEEINAELDAFSYSVSHDLRAPLRAMHGFADALAEDEADRLSEAGRGYAARIVGAAARMDTLIDDLLEYGRLSRAHLAITDVALDDVVGDALHQHDAAILSSGAEIVVQPRLGRVRGHPRTLVQAVANLVGNALKYVPPGRAPRLAIRAERVARGRRLWVEDNGIGIAPEHQERIFGTFERLHGVEQYAGTGIGLAVVRRGLERMGGTCGVQSEPGHGSRFWIELPEGGRS